MATSGYVDVSVVSSGYIKLRYKWTAGTQNTANNFTPVSWVLQLISTSSSASISSTASKDYTVTTNGTSKTGTNTVGLSGGATKTLASGSMNIYHDSDGTKTFSFSFSQEFNITYSGVSIGTITGSGTGTLDTIPRQSVLGSISTFVLNSSVTIPITKYSSSYTDTLTISLGSTTIKTVSDIEDEDTITFTSAQLATIYGLLPSSTSGTFTFKLTTTSGSTTIGTSTKTVTGTIPSTVKPSISAISITDAVSGIDTQFGSFIQNQSQAYISVTYSVGTGSSLNSISIKLNGESFTSNNCTTNALTTSGSNTCTVTVTDSRGRTATDTETFTVVAYTVPTISSFTVVRCDEDGTTDDMGEYALVNGAATITALSNDNTKSFSLQYKETEDSTWTTVETYTSSYSYTVTDEIVSGISADNTYDFRIVATDYFGSVTKSIELESGFSLIDLRNTGKGIAFGKVSELDAMEINMDIYDEYDTRILNGLSMYSGGNLDPDDSIEELILTQTNTPGSGFWYIRTMFYNTKSTTANRTQIAYPYNQTNKKIFIRSYYSGTWSDWFQAGGAIGTMSTNTGSVSLGDLLIQWGKTVITPVANTPTSVTIKFTTAFSVAPAMVVTAGTNLIGAGVAGASAANITTSSAQIYVNRTNTSATPVFWVAVGEV